MYAFQKGIIMYNDIDCLSCYCLCMDCARYDVSCCIDHEETIGFDKIESCMPYRCFGVELCPDYIMKGVKE